ncbi:EAL domain-containing protein [Marinomonas algarum]|uniref:cyclic-guanylate-specific phosphodiesterase n=1 Tax=Marinomonas algarum TaxID=2883105 RepID=A0A9X1IPA0_9GAMM|nr:EAL domain-containing protein [Marinomonas algarum]MCB5162529.1 EAL domain-containing protein [Marinomonas algarum]
MPAQELLSDLFVETLEQAMDGVVVIDANNLVVFYNRAAEALWGHAKSDVIGQNVKVLVPDQLKPHHDQYVNANRVTGEDKIVGTHREVEIVCKDGTTKWGSMSISKVCVDGENLYTAFVKDVTDAVKERQRIEMLSLVTDKTNNAIFITDASWNVVYINEGFTSILGYCDEDILGRTPISVIAPNFSKIELTKARRTFISGIPVKVDELLQAKSGQKLWCSVMSNPVFNDAGELTHVVTILSEITKTKLHEVLHSRMLGAIARDQPLSIIMESACHEIIRIMTDVTPAIMQVDDHNRLQLLSAPQLPSRFRKTLNNVPIGASVASAGTAAHRRKPVLVTDISTDPLWQDYREAIMPFGYKGSWATPVLGNQGETIGVIVFYRKDHHVPSLLEHQLVNALAPLCALAIEREEQRKNIRHLAYYDSLTKLPNRSMLHAKAEQALREVQQIKNDLAVLYVDLDRFKQINESYGQAVGDKLLIEIAERLKRKCLHLDICGRLSGDEFLLVVTGKRAKALNYFIEELRLSIACPLEIDGDILTPSASIGISIFPEDGNDIGTLMHRADMAMYQAKTAGKGRFAFFSHELNQLALERQEMEVELQKSIVNNELALHYQPQMCMKTGRLYGLEALARWSHPKFGAVSPGRFIPLAEECGLIGDLSRWALKAACQQMAIWRNKGIDIPAVSVNLSPLNFHDTDLCRLIKAQLEENNLQPSDITLELTESVLLDATPSTMQTLHDIHSMGVRFSIDDFGTGYSSLSYLRKIPIKELKLDSSFVFELEHDGTSQSLSKAVLQIGESLNLDVVAEGIERQEQYAILKKQGYHVAQGYLFSKPLNAVEIERWVIDAQTKMVPSST